MYSRRGSLDRAKTRTPQKPIQLLHLKTSTKIAWDDPLKSPLKSKYSISPSSPKVIKPPTTQPSINTHRNSITTPTSLTKIIGDPNHHSHHSHHSHRGHSSGDNHRSGKKRTHQKKEEGGLRTKQRGPDDESRSYTFRDIVHIVEVLVASTKNCRSHAVRAAEQNLQLRLMSLQQIRQAQRTAGEGSELLFDAGYFSSAASKNTHVRLNKNAKHTLMEPPDQRSTISLQMVHKLFLRMKLLSQYPHNMQMALCKVGFYSCFSASRVIIRQGHHPFYFYIIISGSVMVNEWRKNEQTGEMFATTRCILEKGEQFGETALLLNSSRNATVVCQSDCELLVIDKQDFIPMFATHVKSSTSHISGTYKDLDHLRYLSTLIPFQRFPIEIFYTHPMHCVVHYFRKGSVIVRNIDTEWLYVVKSGTCRVVTMVPLADGLKDRARHIIQRLRKMGFGEVEIYDLQVNSHDQKEKNDMICEYIRTPDLKYPEIKTPDLRAHTAQKVKKRAKSECSITPPLKMKSLVASLTQKKVAPAASPSRRTSSPKRLDKVNMFVCVRILKPGDTFGLETMVGETPDIPLIVVSNNAECVMVSKKLYQMSVPADILISIKSRCQNFPYPSSQDICGTLCDQWEWFEYKKHVLRDTLHSHLLHMSQVMI